MTYLVVKLFERIHNDLVKLEIKRSRELTYILKSLGVIKALTNNVKYQKNKPTLQAKMWEITSLLKSNNRA
jgi:hypothetical protein